MKMPPKRTRSATAQQPDGNSSNVTDYMGPPTTKRQKSTAQSANISSRVTRSGQAARAPPEEPQSKAASTRPRTRQQHIEEDDDDGSVHVAFNQVSSAVNEARLGQSRVINGLQPEENQTGPKSVTEDNDEEVAGDAGGEGESPPTLKCGRKSRANQTEQQRPSKNQQTRRNTRSRADAVGSASSVYDEPTPRQRVQQRRIKSSARGTSGGKAAPMKIRQERGSTQKTKAPDEDEQKGDGDLASEDGESGEDIVAAQAAEDSAFIDAPLPAEELPEVKCTVNNLTGMIKTLSHPAWTGKKNWDEDPDMACSTKTGGELIECLRQINDLLLDAHDARYEDDADGDPAVTIDYLRRNNVKAKSLFAEITGLVGHICTRKLAAGDNLSMRGMQTRKRFLCDITKRLMPMLLLVIQKAYDVGPSETKRSILHLTLNSFTIQFPLRTVGWATRIMESLSRGLVQWPIDDEFEKSDEELDIMEVAQKLDKVKKRDMFGAHLASLYLTFKKAADALQRQAREAERKTRREQDRRQSMIRGRELWANDERERQEAQRKFKMQMDKFAQASQDLKLISNPLAEMWKQASQPLRTPAASQVSASNAPVPLLRRSKGKESAVPHVEDDDEFFLHKDDKDHSVGSPVRTGPVPRNDCAQNGVPKTINGLQTARTFEAWGAPRWSKAEEKRLVLRMKLDAKYNPATMAPRLGRSVEDVARKAAGLKAVYRDIYRKRVTSIPAWAW